ncbi:MAG: T9SS type A sorting domain-containing protein, partial [Ignavibacteria bacterium]|nr:T9SS type A sorting domain-containing protein [Ignavibacteria bacterium]
DSHSLVELNDNNIFVNPSNNNLHLLETCNAVDNGTGSGAPGIDFDGNPRPSGQGYDIGAYEYQFSSDMGGNGFSPNSEEFILCQNYPNPFNSTTTINYGLTEKTSVKLKVFDVIGNEMETIINSEQDAGYHKIEYYTSRMSSGVYFYNLQAGSFVETKKMILLK